MQRIKITPHTPSRGLARAVLCACVLVLVMCGTASAWWDSDWSTCQEITINNTVGAALVDYQIKVSLSPAINATSLRVVNVTSGATVAHWNETVVAGSVTELWFLVDIPAGAWCNDTYAIYHGNPAVASTSDYSSTFTKTYNATGLVLELHMDDGTGNSVAVDSSGFDNNGTLMHMNATGNTTSGWQGVDGGQWDNRSDVVFADGDQLRFDGVDDYVDCGNDGSLNFGTGSFSTSFWFKGSTTNWKRLVGKEGDASHSWTCFDDGGNRYKMRWWLRGNSTTVVGAAQPEIVFNNKWHHAVWVVDRTEGEVIWYFDGVKSPIVTDISALAGMHFDSTAPVRIGRSNTGHYTTGTIDEVRIYNRTLSGDEIYRQYIRSKYAADAPTITLGTVVLGYPHSIDLVNGIYGFLNASTPTNSTIDAYKAVGIRTVESTLDGDTIAVGTWDSYLASVQHCYDRNRRAAMRLNLGGDYNSSTYRESVRANLSAYLPDLTGDPYQSTLQYIVLNLTNASGTDRAGFVDEIGQNISEQTDNSFKTMILESLVVDQAYVGASPIHYKSLSTVPDWLDFEAVTLRGNTSLSRVYSGNESFMTSLTDYRDSILNRMRDTSNTSNQYNETYSVMVGDGDIILFNNGSAKVNRTVADASAGYYWAAINDTMMNLSEGAGTVGFNIPALSYDYILKESSLDRIIYISDQSSQLWGGETTVDEEVKYHDGIMDASYTWGGDNTDIRAEFWDPTFTRENTFMIHYEWINCSVIKDYSTYDYIVIADKNANEIANTIARLNDTYGYVSVGDYMDTSGWQVAKTAEIDDWIDNFGVNIFIDGIDSATLGGNASSRLKDLVDHVRDDKDKKVIMNTYTYYQEFATYGDAVMKESCFSRWGGNVNDPTYTWENMTTEKERAEYYISQNIPVLGMSFGDVSDYDKMAFDYAAFAVLYGLSGNNSYRYGQPNFQAQKEIRVYPLGTMLEPSYTETSDTDWNRLYQAGRVHINPADHTWWVDDNKEVNNLTVDVHFYAGGNFGGGQHVKLFANTNESISTIYHYNGVDPLYTWVWRSCELDKSAYADHGHYYVYMYYRGISGGWNFLGEATQVPAGNVKTWYDSTTQNLPETTTGQSWGQLAGYNWMMNLTINYTTSQYVDELVDRISQTPATTLDGYTITHQTMISSDRDIAIPIWAGTQNLSAFSDAKTYLNNSVGNWVEVDINTVADASAGTLDWNLTTVDGEQYGAVRESRGNDMYLYRFLLPHTSIHTFKTNSSAPVPLDPMNLANSTGNFWIHHTWNAGAGNVTDSYNVSVNDVWHNTSPAYYNDTYTAHAWQNITVYAYNSSGTGTLSFGNISDSIQIPNNPVTITDTSDWSGEMGGNVSVDYNATDADSDTPTFSCNRTDLFTDFSTTNGTGNWIAAAGTYYIDFGVSDGWGSTSNYTMTIIANATPPNPTGISNTSGNFWIHHTWAAGSGNITDSYNVSVNSVWHNTTPAYYNDTYTAHAWQNITVFAYNESGTGTLSAGSISQDTQIPNNPITITNTSDWSGDAGKNVYIDYDATDADSDTPTFSCNRTDLFTDFNTATGTGNWTAVEGTYYVDFGVSDGRGSTSNYTMMITVASVGVIPPDPVNLTNVTGNFWVNHIWAAGSGNITDSYNVSVNSVWHNTTPAYYNDTYTAHAWQNITIYAYNSSSTGTLSAGSISQDAQIPNNPVTITNTSDWSGDEGANVYVDYDATDADSDTPTFSCNRTDLFTDFSTSTGTGNWTAIAGTYYVDFGVSDGYGSTDNYTMWIRQNVAPDKPTLVAPANGATGTSTNPTLRVTVTDPDADVINVTFYQQGGSQIGSTQTGIANGSTASVVWSGRSYSTTYYWYAVANDGTAGTQSDTWHFRTQSSGGGGSSHTISITGCNDWNGNTGTTASINFGYWNADSDSPVFTTNATEGTLDAATGVWTWATGAGDGGAYNWWFRVTNAYGNSDDCTVTVTVYTGDTPLNLASTTGNFWVDHTWTAVAGASEYRVRVNGAWHNGTATHYLNTLMAPHGWSNITLASYNASTGCSSFITDDVQIPNNPITITNYSNQNVFVGDNVTVDLDYADLDGDTPTFSCSRTDLFTDFDTATGTGNWTTAANGTFEIDFGVSDGWGSVSNCTMKIRVGERPTLPTTIPISIWITITVLLFGFVVYTLHTKGYVQKIFGGMISVTMAYILSQQIVSGNVVQITTMLSSTDTVITEKVEVVIPELAYLLLFVAAIMSLVTSVFIVKYIQFLYQKANAIKSKEDDL